MQTEFGIHHTRRLESLFDKYVTSADMTYTKLSSFSTLVTLVVVTSYNIGLPGIYRPFNESDPGCEVCHTVVKGCVPASQRQRSGMFVLTSATLCNAISNLA